MNGKARLAGLALCAALLAAPASAATRSGSVVKVLDGDSVRVKVGKKVVKVDLLGIKAADDCGDDPAGKLRSLLRKGTRVKLKSDGSRKGAYVYRGTRFINRDMLAAGMARLSGSGLRESARLAAAQQAAIDATRGVWACTDPPAPPP